MKRKNEREGIMPSPASEPEKAHKVGYGLKRTEQIDRQLPVLLEYIQSVTKPEFIPKEIASASTILYAVQEGLISRNGDVFKIESSLTPASPTAIGGNSEETGINYPFSDGMVFCSRHSKNSDIIEVDQCSACIKPGKKYPSL